jgi:oligopeptidase B
MSSPFPDHTAPTAPKIPTSTTQLGYTRHDDYAWLKDKNWQTVMQDPTALDPDIHKFLVTENEYCTHMMAHTDPLQSQLLSELKGRIKDDDTQVPAPDGMYEYMHKFRAGDQHGVYYRRERNPKDAPHESSVSAQDETLLDAEILAKAAKNDGHAFFDIGGVGNSDNHKHLAYSVDLSGAEHYDISVIHSDTGERVGKPVTKTTGEFVWASDNKTLFWVERDDNNRPHKVYRKDVLDADAHAVLVYTEPDAGFFVDVSRSYSGNFINIICNDHTTSETLFIEAAHPERAPVVIEPRQIAREYHVQDHKDDLYILTNRDGAVDFKIMRTSRHEPASYHWQDYVPYRPGVLILDIVMFKNFLVRLERENALPRLVIHDLRTQTEHSISFDEEAYALTLMTDLEYAAPWLRFSYSSPTTPSQIFDYHMETKQRVLRKQTEIPSGHNPDDYMCKRISVPARDGETIPVTLVMRSDFVQDGQAPCLLYGYGSYGLTIPASFRTSILSLVDRGFVYAVAHIRGGMAKGYHWYTDGKLFNKQNTFNDFVDVGRELAHARYTQSGRIVAHGGSAGGLLVGAALNQAPELFAGVIAAVPFVDVLNTMSDDSLPLTPPEWPEWGNPLTDKAAYEEIAAYSPYDNVDEKNYPPVLITAGLTDPRVIYWEPAKWSAILREHQTGTSPILLKTNMDAGHQGDAGRYDALKEVAFEYAFALTICDIEH